MVMPFLAALAPFAPIIGAGISAVGALMAPKPKTGIDLGQLRRDAEKNGFNPLTVLRSGAAASYGHVADTRFSNAMQTFGSGVAQWQYDPYGEAKAVAELRLAEAQIAAFARQGKAPSNLSIGGVPQGEGVLVAGINVPPNKGWSDAQLIEDRYGDVASWAYGLGVIAADAVPKAAELWQGTPWGGLVDLGRRAHDAVTSQTFAPAGDAEHSMNYGWKW